MANISIHLPTYNQLVDFVYANCEPIPTYYQPQTYLYLIYLHTTYLWTPLYIPTYLSLAPSLPRSLNYLQPSNYLFIVNIRVSHDK